MTATTWYNDDGLLIKYGRTEGEAGGAASSEPR